MAEPLPIGTLVRVKESALADNSNYVDLNRRTVEYHGYIYFIEENDHVDPMRPSATDPYRCRSLVTGEADIAWLPFEIEAPEGNDE